MSRLFDGVDDVMTYASVPSAINVVGDHTLLVVVRILAAGTTWQSFLESKTSGAAVAASMGRENSEVPLGSTYWAQGSTQSFANVVASSDNWMVLAATKAAGTSAPRFHRSVLATGPTHTHTNGGSVAASASITGGTLYLGGPSDFANIRLAAAAVFTKVLSDAEVEGIAVAKTTASIYALTPVWLVDDNDAFATDYMGNASRTAITGTADDADDPSGWVYGVSSNITVTVPGAGASTASGPQPLVSTLTRPYTLVTIS